MGVKYCEYIKVVSLMKVNYLKVLVVGDSFNLGMFVSDFISDGILW